ncbi:unnamed protein product [Rotaria sordida]|uniref:Uncharacterized protein n=1 Tax=Rotaria sordida TaxID=392033 RepID=A0A813ZET5_9BILA|nr:unnamed protein product [Rotaria sordida]
MKRNTENQFSKTIYSFTNIKVSLTIHYCCEAQHEIRKAVRAKKNRKIHEGRKKIARGRKTVRYVKNQAKAPFYYGADKAHRKYQKTKRKMNAIGHIIRS